VNTFVIGINHKTSSIDIREKFFLGKPDCELLLAQLKSSPFVIEALVLSTCNRTEIYAHLIEDDPDLLIRHLFRLKKIEYTSELRKHFYVHASNQAIVHLLRVSGGIESLVLGEKQILGQVKAAIELSRGAGMLGKYFNLVTNAAIRVGKKAQNETLIGCGGSSTSWAAITMAHSLLGSLENKNILILGAGKMGKLTVNHLQNKGLANIYIVNRSYEKAVTLAEKCGGTAVGFWDLKMAMQNSDICICSVGAPHYIIDTALVREVIEKRAHREMLFIDISMPRNIDPAVSEISRVQLKSIDELDPIMEETVKKRQDSVRNVEAIIENKLEHVCAKWSKIRELENSDFFQYNGGVKDAVTGPQYTCL